MGGVTAGIGRFYSIATERRDLLGYLYASSRLMGYATAAVAAIGLMLLTKLLLFGYYQWVGLAAAALLLSVITGYNSTLSGIQNAARQRAIVALHGSLAAWQKIMKDVAMIIW